MITYTLTSSTFKAFLYIRIYANNDCINSAFLGAEQLITQGALAYCYQMGYTGEQAKGILKAYPENFSLCVFDSHNQKLNEEGGLEPTFVYKPVYDEEADKIRWEASDAH